MKPPILCTLVLLALVSRGTRLVPFAQGPEGKEWIETVVPRMASAEAQLGHARRLNRQMAEKEGDELVFWRKLAVEAYQAVRVFHPEARASAETLAQVTDRTNEQSTTVAAASGGANGSSAT